MRRFPFTYTVAALTIGLGAPACALAQSPSPGNPAPATPGPIAAAVKGPVVAVETRSINGKVAAINPGMRLVVVDGDNGRMTSMFVGPNVRNFNNLKLGDRVTMRYTEALALAIAKGGPGAESKLGEIRTKVEADAAGQAALGGKPGMSATERTTLVANVFEIDRARSILTLRGTDGVPVDIKVADKNALDQIKLNDQIVIGYRQSAVLSIEPG